MNIKSSFAYHCADFIKVFLCPINVGTADERILFFLIDQIRQACAGEYSLVILSPESLFSGKWRDIMMGDIYRERVLVLAVDEAHCCIEWYA